LSQPPLEMTPIGILGGSFDPVHNAHLRLAEQALAALALGSIRWMPSGVPGHRDSPLAGTRERLDMLVLALGDHPRYSLDDFELRSGKPTYTVHTLARLRSELGQTVPLVFLIGADQLLALDRWKDWRTLFELAHFGVARRPGYPVRTSSMRAELAAEFAQRCAAPHEIALRPAGLIVPFDMTPLEISSSAIREALAAGRSPETMLPGPVLGYIMSKGLYR
jgi:nicotinate-nucleotide adenylyltransferase